MTLLHWGEMKRRYEFEVAHPYKGDMVVARVMTGSNRAHAATSGFLSLGPEVVPDMFCPSSRHYADSKRARRREMADFMARGYFVREIG